MVEIPGVDEIVCFKYKEEKRARERDLGTPTLKDRGRKRSLWREG